MLHMGVIENTCCCLNSQANCQRQKFALQSDLKIWLQLSRFEEKRFDEKNRPLRSIEVGFENCGELSRVLYFEDEE